MWRFALRPALNFVCACVPESTEGISDLDAFLADVDMVVVLIEPVERIYVASLIHWPFHPIRWT